MILLIQKQNHPACRKQAEEEILHEQQRRLAPSPSFWNPVRRQEAPFYILQAFGDAGSAAESEKDARRAEKVIKKPRSRSEQERIPIQARQCRLRQFHSGQRNSFPKNPPRGDFSVSSAS